MLFKIYIFFLDILDLNSIGRVVSMADGVATVSGLHGVLAGELAIIKVFTNIFFTFFKYAMTRKNILLFNPFLLIMQNTGSQNSIIDKSALMLVCNVWISGFFVILILRLFFGVHFKLPESTNSIKLDTADTLLPSTTQYSRWSWLFDLSDRRWAFIIGTLLYIISWKGVKELAYNIIHPLNNLYYENFLEYARIFGRSCLVSADDALIYLTVCQYPHVTILWDYSPYGGYCKGGILTSFNPDYGSANVYFAVFVLIIKWLWLFLLPFVVKNIRAWQLWFFSFLFIALGWHILWRFGAIHIGCGLTPKAPITFTYAEMYNMLNYRWLDNTWNDVGYLLMQWNMRIEKVTIFFGLFVLLSLTKFWVEFIQHRPYLLKKTSNMQKALQTRPRFILVNMFVSAMIIPILIKHVLQLYPSVTLHNLSEFTIISIILIPAVWYKLEIFIGKYSWLIFSNPRGATFWERATTQARSTAQRYPRAANVGRRVGDFLGIYGGWRLLDSAFNVDNLNTLPTETNSQIYNHTHYHNHNHYYLPSHNPFSHNPSGRLNEQSSLQQRLEFYRGPLPNTFFHPIDDSISSESRDTDRRS